MPFVNKFTKTSSKFNIRFKTLIINKIKISQKPNQPFGMLTQ